MILYGPAMDALRGVATAGAFLEPPPGRWDYRAKNIKLGLVEAERKGYYVAPWWGVWRQWTGTARASRIDLCVDVLGPMPEFPGIETGWRRVESPDGVTFYRDSTETLWRVYWYRTEEKALEARPAEYIAQLREGGFSPTDPVRYEVQLHGSLARAAAECDDAAAAWARVKDPEAMSVPRPSGLGPVLMADRRPTVPPASVTEAARRMEKYIEDTARRYGKRCGATAAEFREALWRELAKSVGREARRRKDATPERELAQAARARKKLTGQ